MIELTTYDEGSVWVNVRQICYAYTWRQAQGEFQGMTVVGFGGPDDWILVREPLEEVRRLFATYNTYPS